MKSRSTFLTSKLGRRIFVMFICCSLLPITVLSALSFGQVMQNLKHQSHRRLQQSTKAVGMSIIERLLLLEGEMRRVASGISNGTETGRAPDEEPDAGFLAKRFKCIVRWDAGGNMTPLVGDARSLPVLTGLDMEKLSSGKTAVITRSTSPLQSQIFMVRGWDPAAPGAGLLVGEVSATYLWSIGPENTLPPMTEFTILDPSNNVIISSIEEPSGLVEKLQSLAGREASRVFEWQSPEMDYLAAHWTIFMQSRFVAPNWSVVLCQSEADVLAPLEDFKRVFPLVILASLLLVAFLSMYYIRQTLAPLETLKEGIQQISKRDFDTRIKVSSGDEFEDVAATFNEMSAQLGRQFKALTTMARIDRAILSSLDTEKIIATALTGMRGFFACDMISINLLDSPGRHTAVSYVTNGDLERENVVRHVSFREEELRQCMDNHEHMIFHSDHGIPRYLRGFEGNGVRSCLVLPVFVKGRLSATVNMGYLQSGEPPHDDLYQARQLADQMAVALSNSSLIEELDQLNWGTLQALARTVDAKSPWTAGHSERVMEVSMAIAREMGFSREERDILHRGAFLHDIGKIGITSRILDKPGRLTDEEYEVIKGHPRIGARILEPIAAYEAVIPIVLQHHERFDGRGYPLGLHGDHIHPGARILTVADVYDAMLANRPYRAGMPLEDVIEFLVAASGSQFDPEVVNALLKVVEHAEGPPGA